MSLNYSPKIVTNGLALCLDAGDLRSYAGSGTTWSDRSGNGNNVTLVNGIGYNSSNRGSLVFDGINDYADFFAPNLGTTTTVEMWCKIGTGYGSAKMFFGWNRYCVFTTSGHIGYNTGNSDCYGVDVSDITALGVVNNWAQYIFEMRSDVSYTNNKIYINSILQNLANKAVVLEGSIHRNFNSGNGRISGWRLNAGYYMPMNCASFRVYNRALSADEIKQNFEATRSRFGI